LNTPPPRDDSRFINLFSRPNASTRLVGHPARLDGPGMDASALAEAYETARADLIRLGAGAAGVNGYGLYWIRGREWGSLALPAKRGAYAILGRHTSCDGVMPHDPDLSLRHLLASALPLDDGALGLRLLDLRGSLPFYLDDHSPRRSIFVTGPAAVRLGRYALIGLPTGGDAPPKELPAPAIEDAPRAPRFSRGPRFTSRITVLPPLTGIEQMKVAANDASGAFARITLEGAGRSASIELSEAELDRGVLIGRADKCTDRGLRSVLNEGISRSHLLVLREGDEVYAFDTGSTQGTYARGERVRCARLPKEGAELLLGLERPVRLLWQTR
jgi:FHA domain